MPALELKNLKKHFGGIKAVDGIDLSIEKGEIFGFLGPNGAGKTTTIRCIMDFIRPTGGKILVQGKDSINDTVQIKDNIGYLPADISVYGTWTGKEHFDFVQSTKGKSPLLFDLIRQLDFDPKMQARFLSTGNKQKLGLILTLMSDPEIIIMDEPTKGLDPILQNEIKKILVKCKERGRTIFLSSHVLSEVEEICDRVAVIKQGKIVKMGQVHELNEMRLHNVHAYFKERPNKNDFEIDNVEITNEIDNSILFKVRGDINPLLQKLAKYDLKDIEIAHISLEELFLEFYK